MNYIKTFEEYNSYSEYGQVYNKITKMLKPIGISCYNFPVMGGQSFNIDQNLLRIPGSITSILLKIYTYEYYKENLSIVNYDKILHNKKKIEYYTKMECNANGEKNAMEFHRNFLASLLKSLEKIKEEHAKIRITNAMSCFMPDICDAQIDYIKNNMEYDQEIVIPKSISKLLRNKIDGFPYIGLILKEIKDSSLYDILGLNENEIEELKTLNSMGFDD